MHVIVTRPPAQAAVWVARLRALGVAADALPLIGIAPVDDPAPLQAAWAALGTQALVMFVSANAVQHFFAQRPASAGWPPGTLAGSTGPGTSAALREAGVPAACLVEPAADAPAFDSEALWAQLSGQSWAGRRVLVVRGEDGRDWLAQTLREQGAEVGFVAAYRRLPPQLDAAGQALVDAALAAPGRHLWVFSSSEAVAHLQALRPAADWSAAHAVASHPRIVQTVQAAGFGHVAFVAPVAEVVAALAGPPRQPPATAAGTSIQSPRP